MMCGTRPRGDDRDVPMPVAAWPRTIAAARRAQERLRARLRVGGGPGRVRRVAGADCAFSADGRRILAAVAVLDFPSLVTVASAWATGPVTFPYVPGYLSFREGPALLRAISRLDVAPDLWLFDGQGIAHPRGIGLAAHLGVLLDAPSVGCAKSRLIGAHHAPGVRRGSWTPLVVAGRRVGAVVRTRDGVRPLWVSVGHRISLPMALRYVLACARCRVPEPIRRAETLVNHLKRGGATAGFGG